MSFSRHTSRIYMEPDDIQGAVNVLSRRLDEGLFEDRREYYLGALITLELIQRQENIRTQADYIQMLDVQLYECGCIEEISKGEQQIEEV